MEEVEALIRKQWSREENTERHGRRHREGIKLSQARLRRSTIPTIIETE